MTFRLFHTLDYPVLISWWIAWKWAPVPLEALPKTGVIVFSEEKPICAGFLYSTDSDMAVLEWVISNPDTVNLERREALVLLIKTLCELARGMGFRTVFTSSNHPGLLKTYEAAGFEVTDRTVTHLVRRLS